LEEIAESKKINRVPFEDKINTKDANNSHNKIFHLDYENEKENTLNVNNNYKEDTIYDAAISTTIAPRRLESVIRRGTIRTFDDTKKVT